jgi:hypothetical protein
MSNTPVKNEYSEDKWSRAQLLETHDLTFVIAMRDVLIHVKDEGKKLGQHDYFNREFDSGQTLFEQLSNRDICGVSAGSLAEAQCLMVFAQALVDNNLYILEGVFDDHPEDASWTIPEMVKMISDSKDGHVEMVATSSEDMKTMYSLYKVSQPNAKTLLKTFRKHFF